MSHPDADALETLGCLWEERPRGAPGFPDLAPRLRALHRDAASLTLEYDPAAAPEVAALVDAERVCCPGLAWELSGTPPVRVRITASPEQLTVLEQAARGVAG